LGQIQSHISLHSQIAENKAQSFTTIQASVSAPKLF
jgi:hypothetical protein